MVGEKEAVRRKEGHVKGANEADTTTLDVQLDANW